MAKHHKTDSDSFMIWLNRCNFQITGWISRFHLQKKGRSTWQGEIEAWNLTKHGPGGEMFEQKLQASFIEPKKHKTCKILICHFFYPFVETIISRSYRIHVRNLLWPCNLNSFKLHCPWFFERLNVHPFALNEHCRVFCCWCFPHPGRNRCTSRFW